MKNYFCLYHAGFSGTWLTWFINQHASFPQYRKANLLTDSTVTDLCCHGATWCYKPDDMSGISYDIPCTYDQYVNDISMRYTRNNIATKNCIKVLPDHALADQDNNSDLLAEVMSHADYIIMPVLNPDSHMASLFERRAEFMWSSILDTPINIMGYYSQVLSGHFEDRFNKPIHYVHIDQLLNGNDAEYTKLLEIINESPLDNWKQIATDYRVDFIERDYGDS